jgi:hypothetical protein
VREIDDLPATVWWGVQVRQYGLHTCTVHACRNLVQLCSNSKLPTRRVSQNASKLSLALRHAQGLYPLLLPYIIQHHINSAATASLCSSKVHHSPESLLSCLFIYFNDARFRHAICDI